jgi:hypothetical protein
MSAEEFNCSEDMLSVVALLSVETIFVNPRKKEEQVRRARQASGLLCHGFRARLFRIVAVNSVATLPLRCRLFVSSCSLYLHTCASPVFFFLFFLWRGEGFRVLQPWLLLVVSVRALWVSKCCAS